MTREDLFCAIGAVEEKDLLQAQKKRISPIIWIIAAAAVLLAIFFLIHRETPLSHTVLEEKASWNMDADIYVERDQLMCVLSSVIDFEFAFTRGLAVHARVAETLPDTYLIPEKTLNRDNYRVLRLEIVEAIAGRDLPREIWFLLPERYFTDLSGYDLLISLDQVGLEDYLLFNTTRQQYETFSLMFSASTRSHEYDPEFGADPTAVSTGITLGLLPFRNEALHWPENDEWAGLADSFDYFSARETSPYPIAPNTTLDEAKAAIRQSRIDGPFKDAEEVSVRYADEYNMGIRLTDVDTPKDGVFSQIIHNYEKKILLCRIVDGFYANECYMYYDDGRIEASDTKFTQEEIAALPKLAPVVQQVLQRAPETGTCRTFVGYYYKTNQGDLFGVVQAEWEINWETKVTVNMLVKPDGSVTQISTETLQAYLQGDKETAQYLEALDPIRDQGYASGEMLFRIPEGWHNFDQYCVTTDGKLLRCGLWGTLAVGKLTPYTLDPAVFQSMLQGARAEWAESFSADSILQQLKQVWLVTPANTDYPEFQYLLLLKSGKLLLAYGRDPTGLQEDAVAPYITLIETLTPYGATRDFFKQSKSDMEHYKQTQPEYYQQWLVLRQLYAPEEI